jgi:hypothetical protein
MNCGIHSSSLWRDFDTRGLMSVLYSNIWRVLWIHIPNASVSVTLAWREVHVFLRVNYGYIKGSDGGCAAAGSVVSRPSSINRGCQDWPCIVLYECIQQCEDVWQVWVVLYILLFITNLWWWWWFCVAWISYSLTYYYNGVLMAKSISDDVMLSNIGPIWRNRDSHSWGLHVLVIFKTDNNWAILIFHPKVNTPKC